MQIPVLVHVAAGAAALITGYVALYAAKGGRLHRRSGSAFVYVMLVMAGTGAIIAALADNDGTVIAGVMTCYLVITAWTTVRRPAAWKPRLEAGLMLLALGVGLVSLALGFHTALSPTGTRGGLPPFPFFMFGTVGVLAGAGDARMLYSGGIAGARRLARHLWRMCWALWIAATSFFFGQADKFPEALRIMPLLSMPVLAVTATMLYWLWRVRVRGYVAGRSGVETSARPRCPEPQTYDAAVRPW